MFSSVYQLPFGKGQRWLNRGGVLDYVLGHWQASGILTLQSGEPFTVTSGFDQSHTGSVGKPPRQIQLGLKFVF